MVPNLSVFQEPRGVMRILQFIFAICAFASTTGFSNEVTITYNCANMTSSVALEYDYPFELDRIPKTQDCLSAYLVGDFSSDAQFFVATGVLSMLYCMGIVGLYVMLSPMYESNALVPMADFLLTVLLAVFWISGSAAWANGVSGLKSVTDYKAILELPYCKPHICSNSVTGSFSSLNISIILGFLNFFLWASDLWFLYKETQWFKGADPNVASNQGMSAA